MVTDGLIKAVSMIGVGHEVFKGIGRVGGNGRKQQAGSTAFWALYRTESTLVNRQASQPAEPRWEYLELPQMGRTEP